MIAERMRFLLQSPIEQADGAGGYLRDWQDQTYLWGEVLPRVAKAGDYRAQALPLQEFKLVLRDAAGSGARIGWRLIAEDLIFEIIGFGKAVGNRFEVLARKESAHGL